MPADIIVTWCLDDTYHTMALYIPLNCLDFLKREVSTGTDDVICSCPEQEVLWRSRPPLLPHCDHWSSCPDLFNLYRTNSDLCY